MTSIQKWKRVVGTALVVIAIIIGLRLILNNISIPQPTAQNQLNSSSVPAYNLRCTKGSIILQEGPTKAVLVIPPCGSENDGYSQWVEIPDAKKHFEMRVTPEDKHCAPGGANCYIVQALDADQDKPITLAGGSSADAGLGGGSNIPDRIRFKNLEPVPLIVDLDFLG